MYLWKGGVRGVSLCVFCSLCDLDDLFSLQ